jgi:hypothetical protein
VSDLDKLVPRYDLTIVAAGKGELVNLFSRDRSWFISVHQGEPMETVTGGPERS